MKKALSCQLSAVSFAVLAVGGCAHDKPPAPATEPPAATAAEPQQPAQPGAEAAAPAPAPAPAAAPAARPKDPTFAVQGAQNPAAETQSAARALKSGNFELAIQESKRALAKNERHVPAMLTLARAYYSLHKYELCSSILDTAATLDDRNGEIYFIRGQLALARDDKPSALVSFKAATDRDPNHAAAWNDLAAQYIIVHNFDAAAQAAQRAVQLAPTFIKALINFGSALRGLKQYDQAARQYEAALRSDPANADAYYNLGILYLDAEKIGQYDNLARLGLAIKHLQKYKEVAASRLAKDDPADSYISEAQKLIERENKKIERQKKEAARKQPKPAPAAAEGQPAAPTAAPPPAPIPPQGGGNPK